MTNLIESSTWESGIYQLETDDPTLGGQPGFNMGEPVTGHANAQGLQLANRTKWLYDNKSDKNFTQNGIGAVSRSIESKIKDFVSVKDFGAIGDGITNDTMAIRAAITYAQGKNTGLIIDNGTFLVSTFDQQLVSLNFCAFKITGNLTIIGNGEIKSNTSSVTNAIFGFDSTSGQIDFSISDVKFSGDARYRAISAESSASLNSVSIDSVKTSRQSVLLISDIVKSVKVKNSIIGYDITSTTNRSPTLNVTIPSSSTNSPEYSVIENTVITGTEVISTGAYVIHGMPFGGKCVGNTHINIGNANNEGFDIDNVGKFSQICGNSCVGSGFEYKVGSGGYSGSREIIFSNNISIDAPVPFAIQSSCIGYGNIAYNPKQYGIFISPVTDPDNLLQYASMQVHGFRIIYAGAPWTAAVNINPGMNSVELHDIRIEIDPQYKVDNPTSSLPSNQFNIDGDINNLSIINCFIDKSSGDQINIRPTTTLTNLRLDNIRFGDCDNSCIDLSNCNNVLINNPFFPANITDRPIRLSACNAVRIVCDYHPLIALAQTSGANTGVLINNWGQEAAGVGNRPSATSVWPLGCVVSNTSDSTVWLRVSASATPATAWKQIA